MSADKQTSRPDFGWHEVETVEGVKLTCRYIAPGLTLHDLVRIHNEAAKQATPSDEIAGNPAKWSITRGVNAVAEALLTAIYGTESA